MQGIEMNFLKTWALNKIVVLFLIGGFATLVVDLRSEHVDVLRQNWEPWIPIAYSAAMVALGLVGLARWDRGGRPGLLIGFSVAFVVGALGFWFHNQGHLVSAVITVLSAWTKPVHHADAPPPLAPLSFIGLGVLGMLACARGFQPGTPRV